MFHHCCICHPISDSIIIICICLHHPHPMTLIMLPILSCESNKFNTLCICCYHIYGIYLSLSLPMLSPYSCTPDTSLLLLFPLLWIYENTLSIIIYLNWYHNIAIILSSTVSVLAQLLFSMSYSTSIVPAPQKNVFDIPPSWLSDLSYLTSTPLSFILYFYEITYQLGYSLYYHSTL